MDIDSLPPLGTKVPDLHHAISVQLPTWQDMCGLGRGEARVLKALQNGYPRSFLHADIRKLHQQCHTGLDPNSMLLLFPSERYATACREYLEKQAAGVTVTVSPFQFEADGIIRLWGAIYPSELSVAGAYFWRLSGTGISSRLAEKCLGGTLIAEEPEAPVYQTVRARIANYLQLSDPANVYLYPSGMSAIYHVHQMLLQLHGLPSAIVGFPYELTTKMLQTYGPGLHFYSLGTDAEIDRFEADLTSGTKIQAVWCECPSNPLLWTVDLTRIRRLADRFDFVVMLDDTIGTFANVDVMPIADVVVSSLSKSFNGHADLLAGSLALNPTSPHYNTLKQALSKSYTNHLYIDDVIQLEQNSRDFLQRQTILNTNAEYLVDYVYPFVADPCSVVQAVYYPKISPSAPRFEERMRKPTEDFTPGYGCLFTIDFKTVAASTAFFDNLAFLKGPSLGLQHTLAQPYVQMVLQNDKPWAASHGVPETIVRISAGLENKKTLLKSLQVALEAAEKTSVETVREL